MKRYAVLVVFCVATLAAGAVGSEVSLCLDFFPNPNHAPLYVAAKQGWFDEAGLTVDLVVPANVSDPLKLAAAGRFDVALTPQINYLIARSQGLPLIAIGALIDRNLGGLLARTSEGIVDLADLRGKRIGYSLAPLEPILWETMLSCAGVDIHEVELVNVGYNTVPSLLSGGVDAIGAFRNYEAIQLELLGEQATFFPQEVYCIPDTYDILLVCRASLVEERPDALRGLLAAVARGVGMTRSSPNDALALFLQANPDLDDELNRRSFAATVPLFATGLQLDDPEQWAAMQTYLFEHGLIDHVFDLDVLYTAELLPPETP